MITLLSGATGTTTGRTFQPPASGCYQATVDGTGAVSATVLIEASVDGANWLTLATISLSGTTSATDGFVAAGGWPNVRARVSAISGTGAAVNVLMS